MKAYETIFVLNPDMEKEAMDAIINNVKSVIETAGEVKGVDEWGKRKLAYEIDYISEGYYVLMKFTSGADFPAELDRILGITDGIMRRLITLRAE